MSGTGVGNTWNYQEAIEGDWFEWRPNVIFIVGCNSNCNNNHLNTNNCVTNVFGFRDQFTKPE